MGFAESGISNHVQVLNFVLKNVLYENEERSDGNTQSPSAVFCSVRYQLSQTKKEKKILKKRLFALTVCHTTAVNMWSSLITQRSDQPFWECSLEAESGTAFSSGGQLQKCWSFSLKKPSQTRQQWCVAEGGGTASRVLALWNISDILWRDHQVKRHQLESSKPGR